MMNIISANSPCYTETGGINLIVTFDDIGVVPFTVRSDDSSEHGRDLYARVVAGEFGLIAPYVAPAETPEQIQAHLTVAVQAHLDTTARADGWDSIYTASLRASNPDGPWYTAGLAYLAWMDACWVRCHEVQAGVAAGTRVVPTAAELIAELPALVRP